MCIWMGSSRCNTFSCPIYFDVFLSKCGVMNYILYSMIFAFICMHSFAMEEGVNHFDELPDELVDQVIFKYLTDVKDSNNFSACCVRFSKSGKDKIDLAESFFSSWSKKSKREILSFDPSEIDDMVKMACLATYSTLAKTWTVEGPFRIESIFNKQDTTNLKKHFVARVLLGKFALPSEKLLEASIYKQGHYWRDTPSNNLVIGVMFITAIVGGASIAVYVLTHDLHGIFGALLGCGFMELLRRTRASSMSDYLRIEDVQILVATIKEKNW